MSGTRLKNDTGRPFARWTDGRTDGRRFGSIERKTDDSSVKNTGVTKSIFFKTSRKCTFVIFAIFRRLFIGQMFEPVFETTNSASVRPSNLSYQTLAEKRREAGGEKKEERGGEKTPEACICNASHGKHPGVSMPPSPPRYLFAFNLRPLPELSTLTTANTIHQRCIAGHAPSFRRGNRFDETEYVWREENSV